MINAPQSAAVFHQWVMNTISQAWGRFKSQNMYCWALLGDTLYCGGATKVYVADDGYDDDGAAIAGAIKWAFSPMGRPSYKRVSMIRPHIVANGSPAISVGVDVDFGDVEPVDVPVGVALAAQATWGSATWGSSVWGGGTNVIRQWTLAGGFGTWLAPRIATNTSNYTISFNAIDVAFEPAGRAVIG
jgi:hypothetical protein